MTSAFKPLLITMGDPAGIGPEIIAKAFRDHPQWLGGCVVAGDVAVMRRAAQTVGGLLPVAVLGAPEDAQAAPSRCVPVVQACDAFGVDGAPLPEWGQVNARAGQAAAQCISLAAGLALDGRASGVVTAPIHKEALSAAGIAHPGHTEFLQALAARHRACAVGELPVRMMLANPELKTVLVSIHVSLHQAIEAVTFDNVLQTLRIVQASLGPAGGAGGRALRVAVAGLNPHAGEGGLFGREEIDVIAPAVARACAGGLDAVGPLAPDTVFMRARTGEFDVVVAMYHDQGLIPVKYLGVENGVNVTLGLPFVRTSPDHGTAFDLAGTGRADPSSLCAAIRWARRP
jgi:4-hydroxythreonine-4-phosphate dehydrogenase